MSITALYRDLGESPADLTIVGTGIKFMAHVTLETLSVIEAAEKLYYVTADVMTERWLQELNPGAERLPHYLPDRNRRDTYELWVDVVLQSVRAGRRTCAATYGHPGVLVYFSRAAITRARDEGYRARMLPGIGTDAVMISDLLVDPGPTGWQSYTAAVFLGRAPRFDPRTPLVLWQLRAVGEKGPTTDIDRAGLRRLTQTLLAHYPAEHTVTVYEASKNPAIEPVVQRMPLRRLGEARFRHSATLYVPGLHDGATINDR